MDFISDLQRSFMCLPEKFLQEMTSEDRFLLAFPRSGSRWMIQLLSDLVEVAYRLEPSHFYDRYLEKLSQRTASSSPEPAYLPGRAVIPNAHNSRQESALLSLDVAPMFRSHHLAEVIIRSNGPIIYLVRHPAPALYSYYHYASDGRHVQAGLSLEDFYLGQLPLWKDHVSTMLQLHRASPGRVLFLTYGDPGPFAKHQLEAAAAHFGIPTQPETVDWALSRLAGFFPKLNAHPSTLHFRGVNHVLVSDLPLDLQQWIHAEAGQIYEEVLAVEENRS